MASCTRTSILTGPAAAAAVPTVARGAAPAAEMTAGVIGGSLT